MLVSSFFLVDRSIVVVTSLRGSVVQDDVDQVVAERLVAPEAVFDPECAVQDRIILLGGAEFEPDAPEAMQAAQSLLGHVSLVVPKQGAVQRRPISQEGGAKNAEAGPEIPGSRRWRRGRFPSHYSDETRARSATRTGSGFND